MYLIILTLSILLTITAAITMSLNPITIGILILITSLVLTLIYSILLTSWVAFLIFLIYVGGILVIFAYFVALTPNQQRNILRLPITTIFLSSLIIITTRNFRIKIPQLNLNSIRTFYQINNINLLFILAIILLFTIIVVVKLVTNNKGPLRPFIKYV